MTLEDTIRPSEEPEAGDAALESESGDAATDSSSPAEPEPAAAAAPAAETAATRPAADGRVCPNGGCRYDKHEPGANFCILCGTLLFTHCADCLAHNPPYARFCQYCGSDLVELRAADETDES